MTINGETTISQLADIFVSEVRDKAVKDVVNRVRPPSNLVESEIFNINLPNGITEMVIKININNRIIEYRETCEALTPEAKYYVGADRKYNVFLTKSFIESIRKQLSTEILAEILLVRNNYNQSPH